MGEKITIDSEELAKLIRQEIAAAKSEGKEITEEAEEDTEELEDEIEQEVEDTLEDTEKKFSDMTPKETEAFFAGIVKKAMSELDSKKTNNAKKITPKKPAPKIEDDEEEDRSAVRTRHQENREGLPSEPPKKKRFSMWGDD